RAGSDAGPGPPHSCERKKFLEPVVTPEGMATTCTVTPGCCRTPDLAATRGLHCRMCCAHPWASSDSSGRGSSDRSGDPELHGSHRRARAVRHPQLAVHPLDVIAHRFRADAERAGDRLVGPALSEPRKHLALPG